MPITLSPGSGITYNDSTISNSAITVVDPSWR